MNISKLFREILLKTKTADKVLKKIIIQTSELLNRRRKHVYYFILFVFKSWQIPDSFHLIKNIPDLKKTSTNKHLLFDVFFASGSVFKNIWESTQKLMTHTRATHKGFKMAEHMEQVMWRFNRISRIIVKLNESCHLEYWSVTILLF